MVKKVFWCAVICALLAGAYVQETGQDIPYVSPVVHSLQDVFSAFSGSKSGAQGSRLGQRVDQKQTVAGAVAAEPASRQSAFSSGAQVSDSGTVIRVLSDDNKGSRHQRFIIRLASGRTLLIAHNIDLAPRIVGLSTGDTVSFCGEYEPNAKGGVIHWTHRDPAGRHPGGWLQHNGRTYQ